MVIDPQQISAGAMYQFMISVIVPRPIAFVSTVNSAGAFNLAPYSFFAGLSGSPPLLGISINLRAGSPKDTLANIRAVGEFVVNTVSEDLAQRMVQASGDWPEDTSEFEVTGLTALPSEVVRAPRVAESPVQMECRLDREIDLGNTFLVIGEIVRAHVADEVLSHGRVDITKLKPVGRLGGSGYSVVRDVLEIQRPRVERSST